jgi:large subunit ribosomal protein L1
MDRAAIIHSPTGKVSFPPEKLLANIASLIDSVVRSRPAAVKGAFIRSAYLTSSMGPSIKLDIGDLTALQPEP